jgi:hypothetical protein
MLKAFLSSIGNALMSCLRAVGRVATWPLRALTGGGGGMPVPAPDVDEAPAPDPIAERERAMAVGAEMAALLQKWAAESFLAGAPARLPDGLSNEMRRWARGLTPGEVGALIDADETAVSAHIQGVFMLPGVSPVKRLPTAEWDGRQRGLIYGEPSFIPRASLGR